MSTAVMVTSGKGGTGKTSLTAGVASCLAALGHSTLCIDMDVGLRNLDLTLGLSDRALMDFTDVMESRCSLEKAVVEHPEIRDLFLLTAGREIASFIKHTVVRKFLFFVTKKNLSAFYDRDAVVEFSFASARMADKNRQIRPSF